MQRDYEDYRPFYDLCGITSGTEIDDETMIGYLDRLGFQPSIKDGLVSTTVPVHRGDIEREVDLIEEVVRMHGFDAIDLPDDMRLRPASMPPAVDCWRAVSNAWERAMASVGLAVATLVACASAGEGAAASAAAPARRRKRLRIRTRLPH